MNSVDLEVKHVFQISFGPSPERHHEPRLFLMHRVRRRACGWATGHGATMASTCTRRCSPVNEAARRRDRRHWTPQMVRSSMASHLQICLAYTNDIIVSLLDRGRWLGATPSSGVSMPAGLVRVRLGNRCPKQMAAQCQDPARDGTGRYGAGCGRHAPALRASSLEARRSLRARVGDRRGSGRADESPERHGRPSGSLGIVVDGLPGMTRGQPGISRCLPARESRAQPLPTWAWSGAGADIVTKRRVADGDGTVVDETEGKIRGVEAMSAGFGWRLGVTCSWWAQVALISLPGNKEASNAGRIVPTCPVTFRAHRKSSVAFCPVLPVDGRTTTESFSLPAN